MKSTAVLATSLALCGVALTAGAVSAQTPCAVTRSLLDSARAEAVGILFSERPLLTELRKEQGISQSAATVTVSVVRDRSLCERLASQFEHIVPPGTSFAVLRVGSIYYARDPDQRLATGIFADSSFHVLMRLGAAVDK